MIRLIQNPAHYPALHVRDSTYIDFIFGSTSLLPHVVNFGLTHFFSALFEWSNHQGLFLNLDKNTFIGASLHTPIPLTRRTITSKSRYIITNSKQYQVSTYHAKHPFSIESPIPDTTMGSNTIFTVWKHRQQIYCNTFASWETVCDSSGPSVVPNTGHSCANIQVVEY
jgi:hypothetical protein